MASLYRRSSLLLAGLGLLLQAGASHALDLTLPTSGLDANAVFSFSSVSSTMMGRMGIGVSSLGNTTAVSGSAWNFNMPITQVTVSASLLPPNLNPVSGYATGSGLLISDSAGSLALSNFGLNFQTNQLTADLTTASGTIKGFDVFSFTVNQGLHISDSNGLSLAMGLSNMTLTSAAQSQFGTALVLPSYATAALGQLNFGSLGVNISPSLRFGITGQPLAASVPELPRPLMLCMGLLGLAFVTGRRLANLQQRS